jgi:glutamate dehydrogenase (NAD(P)+)
MADISRFADELGPAKIVQVYEPSINLKAVLVVDNVAAGPALGGVRLAPDVSVEECFRLARAMTLKNAAAELTHGGGKVVVYADPNLPRPDKERLIRALACALRHEQDYIFAPDMGTNEECMAWVKDEIGRVVGLPAELGGIPLDEIGATGWGLCQAAEVAVHYCDFELEKARIVIQGFGAVGKHAARFLAAKDAVLVGVADSGGAVYSEDGLDVDELCRLKAAGKSITSYARGKQLEREAIVECPCEILIPAARPDVINSDNMHAVKARLIIQGANIPLTAAAEKYLHGKGILCVPDFIANAGGVICAAMEYQGAREGEVFPAISEKVRHNTDLVLAEAKAKNILPREAALQLALRRVKKSMSFKRWSIY